MQKLKNVKIEMKEWTKKLLGNTYDKLAENTCKSDYVEGKLLHDPNNHRLNAWLHWLLRQREKLLLFNQKYREKMARKEWLVNGYRMSRFSNLELILGERKNR